MSIKMSQNFVQRLWIGGLGVLFIGIAIYYAFDPLLKPLFPLLTGIMICGGLWEFFQIAREKGFVPLVKIGMCSTALYILAVYLQIQSPQFHFLPQVVLGITLIVAFLYYFIKGTDPFVNLALTSFGIFYLTLPLSCVLYILYFFPPDSLQDGRWWLAYTFAVTKTTDMAAYAFGKLWGAHRLAPYISPKKTWEGAIGGFVAAVIVGLLINAWAPLHMSFIKALLLSIAVSALAQFGDLAESLLKRDGGVKDSSRQLPGLGGLLDILDSLVFTVPLIYILLNTHLIP